MQNTWTISDAKSLEDTSFELKLKLAREIGVRRGMTIVDIGCGEGGFTSSLAKTVGSKGYVIAIDESDEYLQEFTARVERYNINKRVTLVLRDATNLKGILSDQVADIVVSYRLLEELRHSEYLPKIVTEMARIVKKDGKVCITELSTTARNEAEENYIRLHRESGDCFFKPEEIVEAMKNAELVKIRKRIVDTSIWFSPELSKQELGFAQVWFDERVKKSLGPLIEKHGMKYPVLQTFSGTKT